MATAASVSAISVALVSFFVGAGKAPGLAHFPAHAGRPATVLRGTKGVASSRGLGQAHQAFGNEGGGQIGLSSAARPTFAQN